MPNHGLRPICFMVMPFGIKETHSGGAPSKVNFDRLWELLFRPLIERLGYEPVRADVDLGASIIRDMIERLALSDLVLADVTIPNANVFYEVGIRHAACESGCVLVAATWAKAPFDTQSMRHEPFALAGTDMTEAEARDNLERLEPRVRKLATSTSPCYEMEGFPRLPIGRANAFREWLRAMNDFNAEVTAVRLEIDLETRRSRAKALLAKQTEQGRLLPLTVAYELVKLARDSMDWKDVVELITQLPEPMRRMPIFVEQKALATSKAGDHEEAIAALLELIEHSGGSDERWGLIGGRNKKLFRQARKEAKSGAAAEYLNRAIESYEKGRLCDLNAYYSASNLPLLLCLRNEPGDAELASRIAVTVVASCERAIELNIADEWVYPTLLTVAFQGGDLDKARQLLPRVRRNPTQWKLESVLADLDDAVSLQPQPSLQTKLGEVRDQLRGALAATAPR